MSNRSALYTLVLVALASWGGLLLFTRLVPPPAFLAFVAFFLILAIALTSTVAPFAYAVSRLFFSPRTQQTTIRSAIRRGALVALIVVLNLILRALSSWNVFTAILIAIAVIVIEVMALSRR
jgi:hypothetical protein